MCGICGYVGNASPLLLPRMLESLVHRGPDEEGLFTAEGVGLGSRRLKILDLTGGRQPITNEDKTLWVVFNGEIYNYRELRRDLITRGHTFATATDTEVIVHLYEEEKERCVEKLRGMFAFALWDAENSLLFLARDRVGKKPLFYTTAGGRFLFASEIKALLEEPSVPREVDRDVLDYYLSFGYTPQGRSIFSGIRKLPPAHTLTLRRGEMSLSRYWDLPTESLDEREESLAERIRETLQEAVNLRLVSDVPLGVFLSGGMDSSSIVATMRELGHDPIATFSIGYGTGAESYDELRYASLVARHFHTDHHEEIVTASALELLPRIIRHFDEPFADSSALPTFLVAQMARRDITVALSGIGGDEAFAGYPRHLGILLSQGYAHLPLLLRKALASCVRPLLRESTESRNIAGWARRFLEGATLPMPDRYVHWLQIFDRTMKRELYTEEGRRPEPAPPLPPEIWRRVQNLPPLPAAFYMDLTAYLPEDLLTMADRMSMAHSVELRAPFCDHKILELSWRIPPRLKLKGGHLKSLLKKAMAPLLPQPVLTRRKQGFMIPIGQWFRRDLKEAVALTLAPERIRRRGLFNPDYVRFLLTEHEAGRRNFTDQIWALLALEIWFQIYMDGNTGWGEAA